jgi:hypothetical protein
MSPETCGFSPAKQLKKLILLGSLGVFTLFLDGPNLAVFGRKLDPTAVTGYNPLQAAFAVG